MQKSEYVYTTFIKTTKEKLWKALTTPEFQKEYFSGMHFDTDWKKGSDWALTPPDGKVTDMGKVLEFKPYKRIVLSWRMVWDPKAKAEGLARCIMDLEPTNNVVKLTITHTINRPNSRLIKAVSGGWPYIISNLKSKLESGQVIMKNYF